ncbi:MAG: 3-hydroxyacyl-ACP dehydratase [Deltaproteobacteria bacterium]|nr:3-hydroxyacyl-ACP dehydratase [Deltaproteobacteria bacterium]
MPVSLTLPMGAEELIPHRKPMRLVDRLLERDELEARAEAVITADNPLVDEEGRLEGAALLEFMAQACAAARGHQDLSAAGPVKKGFLVGVRRVHVVGPARVGDRLEIHMATVGTLEGFSVLEGEVTRDGEVIATGTLKLWVADDADLQRIRP